jgi:hypothetical protein
MTKQCCLGEVFLVWSSLEELGRSGACRHEIERHSPWSWPRRLAHDHNWKFTPEFDTGESWRSKICLKLGNRSWCDQSKYGVRLIEGRWTSCSGCTVKECGGCTILRLKRADCVGWRSSDPGFQMSCARVERWDVLEHRLTVWSLEAALKAVRRTLRAIESIFVIIHWCYSKGEVLSLISGGDDWRRWLSSVRDLKLHSQAWMLRGLQDRRVGVDRGIWCSDCRLAACRKTRVQKRNRVERKEA